jgi:hypothetical protein
MMADPAPITTPVVQHLPFEVRVERWFQSREMWNYIFGLVMSLGPVILNSLGGLGLTPVELLVWTLVVNVAMSAAGLYFKNASVAVVGTKDDVASAATAPEPVKVPGP